MEQVKAIYSEKMAVISTAHMTECEAQTLEQLFEDASKAPIGANRPSGFFLGCDQSIPGLPRLSYVLGFLGGRGFDWVMLDADADEAPGLDTFDW